MSLAEPSDSEHAVQVAHLRTGVGRGCQAASQELVREGEGPSKDQLVPLDSWHLLILLHPPDLQHYRIINKKLGLPAIMSYVVVKDAFNSYIDREVDRGAAKISPEYALGLWSIMRKWCRGSFHWGSWRGRGPPRSSGTGTGPGPPSSWSSSRSRFMDTGGCGLEGGA